MLPDLLVGKFKPCGFPSCKTNKGEFLILRGKNSFQITNYCSGKFKFLNYQQLRPCTHKWENDGRVNPENAGETGKH